MLTLHYELSNHRTPGQILMLDAILYRQGDYIKLHLRRTEKCILYTIIDR